MSRRSASRLRACIAPVEPAEVTRPFLIASNDSVAMLSWFRSSCARTPSRSVASTASACSRRPAYAVTAAANRNHIETEIQRPEIFGRERGVLADRQLGNALTDISVVVHDLTHGEPQIEERVAVKGPASLDVRAVRVARTACELEGDDELVEEGGDSTLKLGLGRLR